MNQSRWNETAKPTRTNCFKGTQQGSQNKMERFMTLCPFFLVKIWRIRSQRKRWTQASQHGEIRLARSPCFLWWSLRGLGIVFDTDLSYSTEFPVPFSRWLPMIPLQLTCHKFLKFDRSFASSSWWVKEVNVFFTSVHPGVALIWALWRTHKPVVDAELLLSMTHDEAEACIKSFL